jgi:hypothetical protein
MLAVVPHLLGFVPASSLVVIGARPPRGLVHVTLRFDLPDPSDDAASGEIAAHAAAVLARERLGTAVVIGYGPGGLVTPVADTVKSKLSDARLYLKDMLRVEDGRYWSYLCRNPACCPPEGIPFDAAAHPAASVMATEGKTVLTDRAALAATIAPIGGLARQSMRQATLRAEQHAVMLLAQASRSGRERAARRLVTSEGLSAVSEAIQTYRRGGKLASDDQPSPTCGSATMPGPGWTPTAAKRTAGCGPTWCAGPSRRMSPRWVRCSPSWRGSAVTVRSPTSPWTGRWPPTPGTRWPSCCGRRSTAAPRRPWPASR